MTVYGKVLLASTVLSGVSGLGQGIFTGEWGAFKNAGKIFYGNFYLDEKRSFFEGVLDGVSRHSWEFIQTGGGNSMSQVRNAFGGVDNVDYFGGATLVNENTRDGL